MASGFLPWYTSQSLVQAVQRKISMPLSQNTFSSDDILQFASEELALALVPQILTYHSEYFVFLEMIGLNPNQLSYPIPSRAIGQRLRSLFYVDTNGNRFEMVLVNADDKSFFQYTNGSNESAFRYYLQGNEVVLTPNSLPSPIGNLEFGYYLRPNQLVDDSRAAIIQNFLFTVVCDNTNIAVGDQFIINTGPNTSFKNWNTPSWFATNINFPNDQNVVFTAVSGSPLAYQFLIGGTSAQTATNLANAIVAAAIPGIISTSTDGLFSTETVSINYSQLGFTYSTTNITNGFVLSPTIGFNMVSVPSNITATTPIDILQTASGHKTFAISVPISSLSGTLLQFDPQLIPINIKIGDYICQEYECIIPQIPSDLQTGLAERTCGRILAAIGDQQGLQATTAKINDITGAQNALLGARVDGEPKKIFPRKTLLRFGKFINYRRF